jgi:hypothetical protein
VTTFTSDDREEAYKKILEEAPNQPGYEDAVPIDVQVNASPPHIVDSGASVMKDKPIAYINVEERKLEWAEPITWHTPTIAQMEKIPLYTHPAKYCPSENNAAYEKGVVDGMSKMTESVVHRAVERMAIKELTDEEIVNVFHEYQGEDRRPFVNFARAILRKAQEK